MQQLKHQASQQLSTLIHRLIILLLSYVLIWPVAASAEGVARLKKFYDEIHTVKADFYQVVTDKQGKKIQEVYGQMQLKRPNKFRWNYSKPFEQQIMSDGKKIWLYDTELAQVSVQDLSKALGSSPAGLLSGDDGLEKNFQLLNVASKDGLDWVRASPKDADAGFNKISLGFNGDVIQEMYMVDNFGHQTKVVFSKVVYNPVIEANAFLLELPKGVDIVSE